MSGCCSSSGGGSGGDAESYLSGWRRLLSGSRSPATKQWTSQCRRRRNFGFHRKKICKIIRGLTGRIVRNFRNRNFAKKWAKGAPCLWWCCRRWWTSATDWAVANRRLFAATAVTRRVWCRRRPSTPSSKICRISRATAITPVSSWTTVVLIIARRAEVNGRHPVDWPQAEATDF